MSECTDCNRGSPVDVLSLVQALVEGQRDFLHALRSPLSVIAGGIEDIRAGIALDSQSKDDLASAVERTLELLQRSAPPEVQSPLRSGAWEEALQNRFILDPSAPITELGQLLSEAARSLLLLVLDLLLKEAGCASDDKAQLSVLVEQEVITLRLNLSARVSRSAPKLLSASDLVVLELACRALHAQHRRTAQPEILLRISRS